MSSQNIQLAVEAIHVIYQHAIIALRGVSLTVNHGEIVALIGANGAGKSTTLRAISNLLSARRGRLTAGSIRFENHDVTQTKPDKLARLGLVQVLEGRHCFRSLTVEENLITGGIVRGSNRAELNYDLDRIYSIFPRLKQKQKTLAGVTSGGEQQMTAIGRALMSRPKLLVLDEPSMGLAPLVVRDIFQSLQKLNRTEGLSLLLAEQNSTIALQVAHRAIVLETGETVLQGTAEELRHRSDIKEFYLGWKPLVPVEV